MADTVERRDFFISFNSADLAYAEAINAALREAGFTTYFHPTDLPVGGFIPKWMDDGLMNSAQMLALYSPEYMAETAVYSEAERYAGYWRDVRGSEFKVIPVMLREVRLTPLLAVYKRIDATNTKPDQAAAKVVAAVKKPDIVKEREYLRVQSLPSIFRAPYRPNPNFTGRFEAMESLQRSLRAGNAAITAVAGLGGVGKTTLAAEYCHRFGSQYGGVWWVRAEQESVLLSDLVELGRRLKLEQTENIEVDARTTLDHLASTSQPWLMVYDNAPNPDAITKWLPVGAVRCIITSRFADFGGVAKVTSLDQWSDEVAADYLLTRTGRDDRAGALRLAHALGGLPLAGEQAAVFLRDRKVISFGDYRRDITRLLKEERPWGSKGEYSDTVYAVFVKSLDAVKARAGGEAALDLVRLCAFLSPDGVDLLLITSNKDGRCLPPKLAAALSDKYAQGDALAALTSFSMLRQEDSFHSLVLIFHRLLLEVMRDLIGSEGRLSWGEAAALLVNQAFPQNPLNPSSWALCSRLMPHIAPLDSHMPMHGTANKVLARLLNQASIYLLARGDVVNGLAFSEKTLVRTRIAFAEEPLVLATALNNIALQYSNVGLLAEAEAHCREALAIREARLQRDDPELLIALTTLAEVYHKQKQFARAEPFFLRAADIYKEFYGPKSIELGDALNNLDTLYDDWAEETGDVQQRQIAASYSDQALEITRAACGERDPKTASRYWNRGMTAARMGNWSLAVTNWQKSLAILLSLNLTGHADTRDSLHDLMNALTNQGELERVRRLRKGDLSELLPIVKEIEAKHREWIKEAPKERRFGPISPFGPSEDDLQKIRKALAATGTDMADLMRRVEKGELSKDDVMSIVLAALNRKH